MRLSAFAEPMLARRESGGFAAAGVGQTRRSGAPAAAAPGGGFDQSFGLSG